MKDNEFRTTGLAADQHDSGFDLTDERPDGAQPVLVEGEDYYIENGLFVFMESFLRRRGYCCDNGCRHCPYPKE